MVVVVYQNILKRTNEGTKEEQTASKALDSVSKVTAPFLFPSICLPAHRHSDCSILKQCSTPVCNMNNDISPLVFSVGLRISYCLTADNMTKYRRER